MPTIEMLNDSMRVWDGREMTAIEGTGLSGEYWEEEERGGAPGGS
jgi:hypothetical protein